MAMDADMHVGVKMRGSAEIQERCLGYHALGLRLGVTIDVR